MTEAKCSFNHHSESSPLPPCAAKRKGQMMELVVACSGIPSSHAFFHLFCKGNAVLSVYNSFPITVRIYGNQYIHYQHL